MSQTKSIAVPPAAGRSTGACGYAPAKAMMMIITRHAERRRTS